jgi:RNA polymerase sigma factor (sigma-70 family)
VIEKETPSELIEFAMSKVTRVAHRIKNRSEISGTDVEDIEQDLLLYVLERADQFDPNQGNHKAFVTRILQSGVAQMLRDAGRQRNNPPDGYKVESFAKMVDGPELKSEELIVALGVGDGDRRRQTVSRDPISQVELAEAIEHQIRTLPQGYRRIARKLKSCNQTQAAKSLKISRRKMSEAMKVIRQHFDETDWLDG